MNEYIILPQKSTLLNQPDVFCTFERMTKRDFDHIRRVTGWSLRELARRSDLSPNTVLSLSSGRNEHPQRRTLHKIAVALRNSSAEFQRLADSLDP